MNDQRQVQFIGNGYLPFKYDSLVSRGREVVMEVQACFSVTDGVIIRNKF
jgi:hypothetical protein